MPELLFAWNHTNTCILLGHRRDRQGNELLATAWAPARGAHVAPRQARRSVSVAAADGGADGLHAEAGGHPERDGASERSLESTAGPGRLLGRVRKPALV